ncbi:hypothetical protein [Pararhizobium qamdonense]|uniref:hypothetical protein n=1 Tax=Pararhizobium qamdonense TaxID=3031126 RepID=UPI0023E272F3|nr:hypothetical protein [Pararhizobium qamdonense]
MSNLLKLMVFALFTLFAEQAAACQQGYYRDSFGFCLPGGSTVIQAINPAVAIGYGVQIVQGLAEGNGDKLKAGIGGLILQQQCAVVCDTVATNVLPDLDAVQLRKIVGEGFIVFATTGDPYLTVIDAVSNTAKQIELKNRTPVSTLPGVPPPTPRAKKTYAAVAVCIGLHKATNKMIAAWISAPTLTADGTGYTFPMVDLRKDDLVQLSAPACPQMDNPETGYVSRTSALISFEESTVTTGGPEQLKYFFLGQQATPEGTPMVAGQ